ncbi:MAG TPA: hypothetical protein PLI22_07980 [Caldisericia bacterium]|jgi:hypothetical protein|nr:hypothetical protein [Caldisericia bacterium]
MNESFEKLNKLFNTESGFDESIKEVNNELQTVEQKKNEIKEIVQKKNEVGFTIEDQGFLIEEVKGLMKLTDSVMVKLEKDIKIGSSASMYEVFSLLANSKVNQLRELRELYKTIMEMSIFGDEESNNKSKNNEDVSMTATDLLKIIKEAQKSSSLNAIEASFSVVDSAEDKKEKKNEDVFKNNYKPKNKKRKIEDDE